MKRFLTTALAALLLLLTVVSCGSQGPVKVKINKIKGDVQIHTELQAAALADDYKVFHTYAGGMEELSYPLPASLSWSASQDVDSFKVVVSESKDMSNPVVYTTVEPSFELINLKIGTTYYYDVIAIDDGAEVGKASSSFKTDPTTPRNIYMDGVANVRDNGGYKTVDGNMVKQGMIYRGGRLNENSGHVVKITEQGKDTFKNQLGIKTEIDLRENPGNGGLTDEGVVDPSIKYVNCQMVGSSPYLMKVNFQSIVDMFEVLAHEENYPIYYHCSIGTDRTGMMSFFMLALLGVDEESIYRDYLFSNFGEIGRNRTYQEDIRYHFNYIKNMGDTLSAKARTFLVGIGVPEENIDAFVEIMTEYKK